MPATHIDGYVHARPWALASWLYGVLAAINRYSLELMHAFQRYAFYELIQLTFIVTDLDVMINDNVVCCHMDYPQHNNKLLACRHKWFYMQKKTICTVWTKSCTKYVQDYNPCWQTHCLFNLWTMAVANSREAKLECWETLTLKSFKPLGAGGRVWWN